MCLKLYILFTTSFVPANAKLFIFSPSSFKNLCSSVASYVHGSDLCLLIGYLSICICSGHTFPFLTFETSDRDMTLN